jgi:ribosome-associated translation inhibitor RaiA
MEINIFKKNLNKTEEEAFDSNIEAKTNAIQALLKTFAKDAKLLKVSVEKFEKHDAYDVEFCLSLPAKTIYAKEASHALTKAMDLSKIRMLSQIKKYMAQLRGDRDHKSIKGKESHVLEKMEEAMWRR